MKRLRSKSKVHTEDKTFLYSDDMLSDAVDAVLGSVKINRKFDVPYVAGYNTKGTIVYIDKDVPKYHRFNGKKYLLDKYLVVHEVVEKILEEQIHDVNYFYAHQIALRIEQDVVEADGLDWKEYDDFMQTLIKEVDIQKIQKVPPDLDLQPYKDSKDFALIEHMKKHMVEESVADMVFLSTLLT